MKIVRRITLLAAGLSLLLFSACTEDFPEREESYVPAENVAKVYFPGNATSKFEVEPSVNSVDVTVKRVNTSAALTVDLTVNDYKGVFTVPSSVQFAAGEAEKTITISFEGLEVFTEYKLELILDEQHTNPYLPNDNATTNVVITVLQTDWADFATGTYESTFSRFKGSWTQVLQYSEILGSYRFPNVWGAGNHWSFKWDGGEAIVPSGNVNSSGYYVVQTGYIDAAYGMISCATDPSTDYTFYDAESDSFQFDRQWTVSAGSFGWFTEYYQITERF